MTKLLLSLLALLTGFSAAEAARPVENAPAALGSAAAFAAIVVADQATVQAEACTFQASPVPVIAPVVGNENDVAPRPACTQRSDRSRE